MGVEAFGIEKEFLKDLLKQVDGGLTQLPDFQRGWVWPDRNIAALIASISLGYPAGTVMMLQHGGDVVVLEALSRLAQRPCRRKDGPGALEPQPVEHERHCRAGRSHTEP